jgi:hypothetical protein
MPTYTVEVSGIVGRDWTPPVVPEPDPDPVPTPSGTTIFGFNTAEDAPLSSRLAKWNNRAPCVRRYNSSFLDSASFPITTAIAPEKRVSYSVKVNNSGPYTMSGLGSGAGNSMLTDWCEDIPPNWTVYLTFYHEPNDDIRAGNFTATQFRNVYSQFRTAIDNATLQSGVTVELVSNFMAYRVADTPTYFDDSWVPPEADIMTFDLYYNPGHFTTQVLAPNCSFSSGAEYGASFPSHTTRWRDTFEAIVRNGYKDRWGVLEFNGPPRDWDGPANPDYVCGTDKRKRYQGGRTASGHNTSGTEVERAAALKGGVDLCLSQPTVLGQKMAKPEIFLFWEHPAGVNWNQKFYHDNVWNALKPYIVGTPVGGGTA